MEGQSLYYLEKKNGEGASCLSLRQYDNYRSQTLRRVRSLLIDYPSFSAEGLVWLVVCVC